MDGAPPRALTAEAMPVFSEGTYLILTRWSALRLAVDNEWGGRDSSQKADQLTSNIISWFTQSREPLYIDDVEALLDEAMLSLNTEAEDGSIEEVAYKLMTMHEECLEGNFQSVESLRESKQREVSVHHVRQVVNEDDDEDDDISGDDANENDNSSNMILDAPASRPNMNPVDMPVNDSIPKAATEAGDGWVEVTHKRNRGKRN